MLFQSSEFILLLLAALSAYYLLPRWRTGIIAAANLLFYMVGGLDYTALLLTVSLVNYGLGRCLEAADKPARRKAWLVAGIGLNLLNLAFFKYTLFAVQNLEGWLPWLSVYENPLKDLVMPIGISFYTFQFISYLADLYLGRLAAEKSFGRFWIFAAFFPYRVSGPIVRGGDILPQVKSLGQIRFDRENFQLGLVFISLGLAKKIFIADYLVQAVNPLFNLEKAVNGLYGWAAAYLYAFQLYFDFSAYSEMALGIALLFGLKIPLNFDSPYLAANPRDFWKRWHITLSQWIRDYLYIPMGGSRHGKVRQFASLVGAMTLSGLWHGAAWTFVLWGFYHGLLAMLHHLYRQLLERLGLERFTANALYRLAALGIFFNLVCIGWLYFRADDIAMANAMFGAMLNPGTFVFEPAFLKCLALTAFLYLLHVGEWWLRRHYGELRNWWTGRVPGMLRGLLCALFVVALLSFASSGVNGFIYFKF